MIIAVCTDDPMVDLIASKAQAKNRASFGQWYKVFEKNIPNLGAKEDVFLVAHGAAIGDENQPVIGSKGNDFYLTARDLYSNLTIFPRDYSGSVYVYACESADPGAGGLSFVQKLMQIMRPSYPNLTAYGQTGKPGGPLPAPSDPSWIRA